MVTTIYPASDQSVGAWTTQAAGTTNLFQGLDETSADDADYVQSEDNPSLSGYKVRLGTFVNPGINNGWVLHTRFYRTGAGPIDLVVRMWQGTTLIFTRTFANISGSVVQQDIAITALEAANIVGATPLDVEFVSSFVTPTSFFENRKETVDSKWTIARTGTVATYFDSAGVLQTAVANAARIDHVIGTGVIRGLLVEGSNTNVVLWNRDLTNAAWVKTSVTAVKDQTGIDGVSSSASKITASAGNGTCLQAITLASSNRAQSCYIKRITGSGNIQMTTDNGATWTTITVTGSWAEQEIQVQGSVTNPVVGFRIVTSGDAVAIDFVQNETGWHSSPIATTTVAVTRNADTVTCATSNFSYNATEGTFVLALTPRISANSSNGGCTVAVDDGNTNNRIYSSMFSASGFFGFFVQNAGQGEIVTALGAITATTMTRLISASAYKQDSFASSINGAVASTDLAGNVPTVTTLRLGTATVDPGVPMWLEYIAYFNTRLSEAQLKIISLTPMAIQ